MHDLQKHPYGGRNQVPQQRSRSGRVRAGVGAPEPAAQCDLHCLRGEQGVAVAGDSLEPCSGVRTGLGTQERTVGRRQRRQQHVVAEEKVPCARRTVLPPMPPFTGLGDPVTSVRWASSLFHKFAMALRRRLQTAGAEERIWPTQFAFRTKRGSADGIFVARGLLDLTLADRNGILVMLSLDWDKAFDSISPDGLLYALERFCLPPLFRGLIRAIYSNRTFTVRASGHSSASHIQCFGISQGCPLSPFLFFFFPHTFLLSPRSLCRSPKTKARLRGHVRACGWRKEGRPMVRREGR